MNKNDSSWKFAISLMAMVVVVGLCFMVLTACNKGNFRGRYFRVLAPCI